MKMKPRIGDTVLMHVGGLGRVVDEFRVFPAVVLDVYPEDRMLVDLIVFYPHGICNSHEAVYHPDSPAQQAGADYWTERPDPEPVDEQESE